MADHVNITHPTTRGINSDFYRQSLTEKHLRAELDQLTTWYRALESDLSSIFTRIGKGETCELHYPDGRVMVITGQEQ